MVGACLKRKRMHGVMRCVKFGTRRRRLTGRKLAKYRARKTSLSGIRGAQKYSLDEVMSSLNQANKVEKSKVKAILKRKR